MSSHSRSVDACLEDACDTGVLTLTGKSLRNYPIASEEEAPFSHKDILELDISKNRFHELPLLIYACEGLVRLNCYHNTIRNIPEGLRKLQNLQHVNLSRNFLQKFPLELCQLQKLRSLSINNNRIDEIPEEISRLKELNSLDVSNNCIETLPTSMGELTSLRRLDFHCNKIGIIPQEICRLSLTDLIMSGNLVVHLPTAICRMKLLVELQVDGNPLTLPPPQICNRGKVHIFKYLSRVEQMGADNVSIRRYKSYRNMSSNSSRRRPMSNISASDLESSNGGRSFYDDVVTNAFGSYEYGDASKQRVGDTSRYNGTVASPEKQRKMYMSKHMSGTPASPGTSRRAAQYGVTLPRKPSKEAIKVPAVAKPTATENTPQTTSNAPVVNSHEATTESYPKTSVSPPVSNFTSSNRKLPAESTDRSGSWSSSHPAGGSGKSTTGATLAATVNATHSLSQSDISTHNSSKPKTRSRVTSKEEPVTSSYIEDSLAPMRKGIAAGDPPKSPSPSGSNKANSSANTKVPPPVKIKMEVTPIKGPSKESTPDLEIKTPTAKNQPDTVPIELDSVLAAFKSDMEQEELTFDQEDHQPKPKAQGFSKPSPKAQKKGDLTRYSLSNMSPLLTPTGSPLLSSRSAEGSPSTLKKKSATIAGPLDVELRIHNSSPNLIHRQSFPPREAEWVEKLSSPQRDMKPVFQQLNTKKQQIDYTIKRQKRSIQVELEMIEDVRDSIEMVLGITVSDDMMMKFSDGVILCRLVNRLFPNTIPSIMDKEPMNTVKRTKNIDSFLRACNKLGIKTACKVSDIMDCKNPVKVCECIQALLMKGGHSTV